MPAGISCFSVSSVTLAEVQSKLCITYSWGKELSNFDFNEMQVNSWQYENV